MDRSSEDIQHQMSCPQESVDALTIQMEVAADTRPSASTERVTALDRQLSKTQKMEAKPDSSSSQKYKSGTGDMETQATLASSYLSENNLPSDAVLRLEDGGSLPVNRETVSKCSEYFRTLFTTKLYSPERTQFFPPAVSSKIMTHILHYAYYGTVDIDEDKVCELLRTSDYLCVPDIVQLCCDILNNNLDPENCIGVMRYTSRFYSCSQLESDARRYLLRHFVKVWQQSEELLELPVEELQAIVGADGLNVKNEKIVWECVLRWIDHDTDKRKGHIVDLLKNIRLGLLDRNFLTEKVMCHPHVAGDEASRLVITEVLTYQDKLETMTTRDEEIPTPKFALPRVHDILFVVGGRHKTWRPIDYNETYSARTDRWTKIEDVDRCWLPGQCAAAIGFDIYVIGGKKKRTCL
jgi:kelch-like protein 10